MRTAITLFAIFWHFQPAWGQQPPAGQPGGQPRVPTPGAGNPAGVQPGGLPSQPAVEPNKNVDPNLLSHLNAWQRVMEQTTNFYAEANLTSKNLARETSTQYKASILCLKPNYARMRIDKKIDPNQVTDPMDKAKLQQEYIAYISNGRAVFEYDGAQKKLTEYPLQEEGVGDNLLLTFMSGTLTAKEILKRFDISVAKEDQHYLYLQIKPVEPRDKQEFESMTMVLFRPTINGLAYLPRTVVMRKNNGQEEDHWDFPQPRVNVEGVRPENFQPVQPPKDWKIERAKPRAQAQPQTPNQPEPRVVRPSNP